MVKPQKCSIYFHSMLIHGPVQHELVCSRSVNTEAEERTFKQASNSAKNTDHKVDGFIEALLIRLQCKQMTPDSLTNSYNLTHNDNSRIEKAAETLSSYTGSVFNKTFIHDHITAFQSHLERIAHFLLQGEGIWWYRDTDHAVHFCDSDKDPDSHAEGPHTRNHTLKDVSIRASQSWNKIILDKIRIPLNAVRSYDVHGTLLNLTVLEESNQPENTATPLDDSQEFDANHDGTMDCTPELSSTMTDTTVYCEPPTSMSITVSSSSSESCVITSTPVKQVI